VNIPANAPLTYSSVGGFWTVKDQNASSYIICYNGNPSDPTGLKVFTGQTVVVKSVPMRCMRVG
jgi:hypothetical protein